MPEFSSIYEWTETSPELSNPALERAIEKTGDPQLNSVVMVLMW